MGYFPCGRLEPAGVQQSLWSSNTILEAGALTKQLLLIQTCKGRRLLPSIPEFFLSPFVVLSVESPANSWREISQYYRKSLRKARCQGGWHSQSDHTEPRVFLHQHCLPQLLPFTSLCLGSQDSVFPLVSSTMGRLAGWCPPACSGPRVGSSFVFPLGC